MRRIAIGLILAQVALAGPVGAQERCNQLAREMAMFREERDNAGRELDRVNAMTPPPAKDVALCRALRIFMNDSVYFSDLHKAAAGCFASVDEETAVTTTVKKWVDGAATLIGLYCSNEELRRPVKSKVNACVPNC